ncbi:hypothetical protein D3H65_00060 [Paraflavitalea soli]|uniref:Uncharacterized protein n=1 Tax=Paraflavitalea soli TaxID=2315862 RepID=A0A3B7MLI6_9BACT|nr:hypothetical protein [Paraflavitalea soli]AXY72465.1 hypothetical protein D3H65_00060 [Paraflavitalea soli]
MSTDNLAIPEDFSAFLYWLKEKTEDFWSKDPKTSTGNFKCEEWIYGAKWIGLTDDEIDAVEAKYAVRFMPEHRAFLRILHTIDRKEKIEHADEDGVVIEERPFFYNWLQDDKEIKEYLDWPFRTIFEDVTSPNGVWLKALGGKARFRGRKKGPNHAMVSGSTSLASFEKPPVPGK